MGRSLNQKFFGKRNVGSSSVTADDGIGGKPVASVTIGTPSTFTTRPTMTFAAPGLPGGVTATGTVSSEAHTATVAGTQTIAYASGETVTITGTTGVATFTPTLRTPAILSTVIRASSTTISFGTTTTAMIVGTSIAVTGTITGTGTIGGSVPVSGVSVYFVGATSLSVTVATLHSSYADAVAGTGALTIVAGDGFTGAVFTFGAARSSIASLAVLSRGTFTGALDAGNQATTVASSGAGLTSTVTYRAKAVTIVEAGSGYASAPAATFTQSVAGTSVLGSLVAPQQAAVTMLAFIPTANGGSASSTADIVAQKGSRRFKVKTSEGTGVVSLVAAVLTAGTASIIATDANGSTYWVTKLTKNKALLTQKTMSTAYLFATGATAQWSFSSASSGIVQIANA